MKYTNIFHFKTYQNLPKFAIWQPWLKVHFRPTDKFCDK
jgi:hypothetical protein